MARGQLTTRYSPDTLLKAAVDTRRLSVTACLTYPVHDLAGDYVLPTGGDWSAHRREPWVGLEHYRYLKGSYTDIGHPGAPGVGQNPVVIGWCRESLDQPGADHAVTLKSVDIDGTPHTLPFGTTYFDPNDKLSTHTFAAIERDALPGVSLEFRAPAGYSPRVLKARSPLEPHRPAWHFDRWDGLSYVHCATPVNPGALTVTKSLDPLMRLVSTGKLGSEPLHPVLLKSLAALVPPSTKTTVRVEKAMPDNPSIYDDAAANAGLTDDATGTAEPQALGGIGAKYKFAQAILDALAEYRQDMESSDSPELRKASDKFAAEAEAFAEKVKGTADKHEAKLNGTTEPDTDDEPADVDMSTEDDGQLKAVPSRFAPILKACRVRRFKSAELRAVLERELAPKVEADLRAAMERNERERRRFAREMRIQG